MPIETAADRTAFIDPDEFGAVVTWTLSGGDDPIAFSAIFERPTRLIDGLVEVTLIDREASLLCLEADLPAGAGEGDAVSVKGENQTYTCRALRPDGSGFVVVDLKRAAPVVAFIGLDFSVPANSQYVPLI